MKDKANTKRILAAVHAAPVFMNVDATIDKVVSFIQEGGRQGVDFMVFPEVFVPGYPAWLSAFGPVAAAAANVKYASASIEVPGPEIGRVQIACRSAGVAVALGVSERMAKTRTCFNSQIFIDSDGILIGKHRKLSPTYSEKMMWAQGGGATLKVFDSRVGRVAGLVCSEHTLYGAKQAYIDQYEQIHAASWPALSAMKGRKNFDQIIEGLARSHAYCAQVFVITASNFVDQVTLDWIADNLGEQDLIGRGGGWSAITHPFSAHLAGPASGEDERLLVAEVDLNDLDDGRLLFDGAGHYSRPEVLKSRVNYAPIWADEVKSDRKTPPEQELNLEHNEVEDW